MAIQSGIHMNASAIQDMLENNQTYNGNKSWQQLYSSAALDYQSQSDALMKSYGDTIAQAYKSSLQQQNAVYDLGLTDAGTADIRAQSRQDLMAAYNSYLSNYRTNQSELAYAYAEQKGLYDEALSTEANNYANLYNYASKYWSDVLSGATIAEDDRNSPIIENGKIVGYNPITTSLIDKYGFDWLTREVNGERTPLTGDQLMNVLYDTNGQLTEKGREFYDFIFNNTAYSGYTDVEGNPVTSFDTYISNNDSDLYSWLHSANGFDSTKNRLQTAKGMIGLDPNDQTYEMYRNAEYVIKDIQSLYNTSFDTLSKDKEVVQDWDKFGPTEEILKNATASVNELSGDTRAQSMKRTAQGVIDYTRNKLITSMNKTKEAITSIYNDALDKLQIAFGEDFSKYESEFKKLYDKYNIDYEELLGKTLVERKNDTESYMKDFNKAKSKAKSYSLSNFVKELEQLVNKVYSSK